MTDGQLNHLNSIIQRHNDMMTKKFVKGAQEHGGDLRDRTPMDLIDEALAENIDQFTYLITLKDKLVKMSIPMTHTPGRIPKAGEATIECYLCWNSYGSPVCRQTAVYITPIVEPNGP